MGMQVGHKKVKTDRSKVTETSEPSSCSIFLFCENMVKTQAELSIAFRYRGTTKVAHVSHSFWGYSGEGISSSRPSILKLAYLAETQTLFDI
jgi:hypothetical protein